MARTATPNSLARRHLLEKKISESHALSLAEAYLEADRPSDALAFLVRAGATEKLAEMRERAIEAGDGHEDEGNAYEADRKAYIDAVLDIPIVLPPLVVGISLLILFNVPPFNLFSDWVVFEVPAVILAQFMVASAFAVRTMRVTFDQIPQRFEQVALTLGASRSQAFWTVVLPQTRRGLLAAATLAWARALGEFGPILVFAGATSHRTEVLPTTVFLEMQAGNLPGMLAVSIIMVVLAAVVLVITRLLGLRRLNA